MNPVLPMHHRVPDVEARVFNGTLYFYGSYDGDPDVTYCSREMHVFSTDDLKRFTDHGVVMRSEWTSSGDALIYAPDCVQYNGTYYLYWASSDNKNWVAHSDRPEGPFEDATEMMLPVNQIDPAVLVDDDGSAYFYWGQFDCHCARLSSDMRSVDLSTYRPSVLNEAEHGFHEGPSIRKFGGVYYLVYADISRGRATCLSYATASSPFGPFTKRGVLLDNAGCDRESWNNHGSVVFYAGQHYICYHRASMAREGMRRLCMEKVVMHRDGTMDEAQMTTQGTDSPLNPGTELDAIYACELSGMVRMDPSQRALTRMENGSTAGYRYFDFSGETGCTLMVASIFEGCRVALRLDAPDGEMLGSAEVPCTGGWLSGGHDGFVAVRVAHRAVSGVRAVFVEALCDERRSFSLSRLCFSK